MREPDGLALSSRNSYLNVQQRQQATVLYRSLRLAESLVDSGERDAAVILSRLRKLFSQTPLVKEDYLVLADPQTLAEVKRVDRPTLVAIAAHVGSTRLIDNETIGLGLAEK